MIKHNSFGTLEYFLLDNTNHDQGGTERRRSIPIMLLPLHVQSGTITFCRQIPLIVMVKVGEYRCDCE